ncbi:MAG: RidA family protein [Candidatus Hydrogenedentales bacterium]
MSKRIPELAGIPTPRAPYSHAVAAGNLLFVSGQVALKRDGSGPLKGGTLEQEARLVLDNLKAVLEAAGSSLDQVVKVVAFLANMDDFGAFNQVYKEYFPANAPARSCIQAGRLPFDFQVEVEAIAVLPSGA